MKNKEQSCAIKTSIGGQALMEGIMMRGPKRTAMAVRNPQGEIVIEEWDTKTANRAKIFKLPIIRGVFSFADSLIMGYKCLMRSAEISGLEELEEEERRAKAAKKAAKAAKRAEKRGEPVPEVNVEEQTEEKTEEKKGSSAMTTVIMAVSIVLALVLVIGLFFWLPTFLYSLLARVIPAIDGNPFVQSLFEAVIRLALLVGYMAVVFLMKDIRRTFMYHGAEHKTIFCYEAGLPLTVENVRLQKRFHPRCGTSFLIIMVLVGLVISFFIPTSIPKLARVVIKLLMMPLVMGIGYEFIKLAGKHDNVFTRIISAPGMWMQRITTVEPDDDMIECAIAAIEKVIPDDGSDKMA